MKDKLAKRLKEIQTRGGLKRVATVAKDSINIDERTVELAFSSEIEYERWFGYEVLSHDPSAVDLSRLNNKAPLLWMHNWDDQRGVVDSVRIDPDRKGRAVVRFSRSEAGEQLFQDVIAGIVTKVSVGYLVNAMKLTEEREDCDVYTVTSWTPYEISMVSVPADDTVGVGRAMETGPEESESGIGKNGNIESPHGQDKHSRGLANMKEKITRDASGNLVRAKVDDSGTIVEVIEVIEKAGADVTGARAAGMKAEQDRVRALTELGNAYGASDLAMRMIGEGKTADDMQRELLADFAKERASKPMSEQVRESEIGLTDKEARGYSIMRAVRAILPNATRADKEAAKFEIECSAAAEDAYGKQARGLLIPADVLNRAFSTTNPAGGPGANVIANNLMAGSFIELLRNKTWAMKHCTAMGGLVGNVDIPRQSGASQAYWVGEGQSPTQSTPALDQIHFTPKSLAAYTDITRRLLQQSTPDAELIVRNDLIKVMALALDYAVLYGTGTDSQPKGLVNQTGIHAINLAAAFPTYAEYVDMETRIATSNADVDSMVYVLNAASRGNAKTSLKFPGAAVAQGGTIWEQGNTINGYSTAVTNQIKAGDHFFGNWADYVIAMWGGLDLTVDPYSLSTSGGTRIVTFQDVDFNIRHTQSFTYANDNAVDAP